MMCFNVEMNPVVEIPSEFRNEIMDLYGNLEMYHLEDTILDVIHAVINHDTVTDDYNIKIRYVD